MLEEQTVKKAVKSVYKKLRQKLKHSGLDGDEVLSLAGLGVAEAASEYDADQTAAALLWLKITGMQRAINAYRQEHSRREGVKYVPIRKGDPCRPVCGSDLKPADRQNYDNLEGDIETDQDVFWQADLYKHHSLTEEESAVLVARHADSRTWKETAVAVGLPVKTCQRREASGLEKLRQVLGEEKI